MVDDTSTGTQHRRRLKKNNARYPSSALLASLAAFIPPAILARPVLLPFLYPSIPQSTSTSPPQHQQQASRPKPKRSATASSSSSSTPSTSRQPAASSTPSASEQRRADRLAYNYKPDDTGNFKPTCWSLHGQSNCPRYDPATDGSITEPDIHEVVPGEQPDFPPTSSNSTTSPTASATSTPTPTTTSPTSTSAATPSTPTVEPYTMTFEVSNIPPGWQKSGRTSFYSKNIIIAFSVTLAALICLTIVLCVIWRIRVARERRESERALKEKKREMGLSSQASDDSSSLYHDQDRESTRQRGLRRRRANVRAGDEDDDDNDDQDGDDHGHDGDNNTHEPAMSERNGMTPSTGRKRRTAFMRTFSGKMLTAPMKWKVNRRRRQQQEEEQEQEQEQEEDRTMSEVEEDDEGEGSGRRRRDTTASRASVAPPPLETQNSTSRLLALPLTSPTVEAPIPNSPPPPPPASLQPPNPTTPSPPHDQAEDYDDDDPTSIQPPAYRRRNFGVRPRVRPTTTGPAAPSPMSPRALEKQREAEGAGPAEEVPEEYMYLAGMMPPPVRSTTTAVSTPAGNNSALGLDRRSRGVVVRPPVEQDRDDEDEEEDDVEDGEEQGEARREDVTAHLATDDKSHLARLHQSSSAPSAPPALDSEDEDGQDLRAVVPQEEEIYELEGSGPSSHLPPPPPPTLLPAPPAITSAHLFFPPPPPHEASDLPQYVAGPSAPSLLGPEKLSIVPSAPEDATTLGPSEPPVLPSAPPTENDQAAVGLAVVPSAPPMLEDGEVQQALSLVPSAPPVEDHGDASAPSRAA